MATNVDPEPSLSHPPNNMDSLSERPHGVGDEIKPSPETPQKVQKGVAEKLRGSDNETKPSPETHQKVQEGVAEKLRGSGNEIIESSLAHDAPDKETHGLVTKNRVPDGDTTSSSANKR